MESSDARLAEPETSVATQIILLVFLATFVSAAAVSWISIETARRQLWSQIHETYPATLEQASQRLLRWLAEGRRLTADLATRHASRDTLLTLTRDVASPARRAATETLFRSLAGPAADRSREVRAFVLLAPDGRPLVSTEPGETLSEAEGAALVRPAAPLVQAFARSGRAVVLATSVPVLAADGSLAAYLAGLLPSDGVRDVLASGRIDPSMRLDLLGPGGGLLVHAGLPAETGAPGGDGPLPIGGVREYTNLAGEHVIGSARPLGALGWMLRVEAPYDRAFAPVLSVVQRLLLIDVCVVAIASLLGYAITTRIVRPIEALSEGARRLAAGRFDRELPEAGRRDEIGLLTRTFNEMARRLQRSQAELESANQRLRDQNQSLQASNEVLEQLSITDGLTKLHNHRFFQDHLSREIKRAMRTGEPLAMILLDIDDFKRLNDRLGHAAGDEALQCIAGTLAECVRDSDLLARYGGEEFAVVAASTDLAGATVLAEKLRAAVAARPFTPGDSARAVTLSVSAGVAQYKGDRKAFFRAADRALYRAKAEGKNCVRVAT